MRDGESLRAVAQGVQAVGQMQLVRRQLLAELGASVAPDSRVGLALSNANDAALSDARRRLREGDASAKASRTVPELARHLVASGFHDPTLQMYVAARGGGVGPGGVCVYAASLPLYRYDETVAALAPKKRRGGIRRPRSWGCSRSFDSSTCRTSARISD